MINSSMTSTEVVNRIRDAFRAHLPQSNAWIEPSNLSVTSEVIGGALWSVLQEARNGIDARVMPDTATGEYLDAIAVSPPYNLTRRGETRAEGYVRVTFVGTPIVLAGSIITRSDGVRYMVKCDVTLPPSGIGTVAVTAIDAGPAGNAVSGMPLEDPRGPVVSMGIAGGWPAETDDELRDRLYRSTSQCTFGSVASVECVALNVAGVTDAVATCGGGCGGRVVLHVAYDGREPREDELELIERRLTDGCTLPAFVCVDLLPAQPKTLVIKIGASCADIETAVLKRIIPTRINQIVTIADVLAAVAAEYPSQQVQIYEVLGDPGAGGFFNAVSVVPA